MIEVEIQKWIAQNGPFAAGLKLLSQVDQRQWKRLSTFANGFITSEIKKQLVNALQPFAISSLPQLSGSQEAAAIEVPTVVPSVIQELKDDGRTHLKLYADAKARLRMMFDESDKFTDTDRHRISIEIMEQILPNTDAIYFRIKEYEQTGKMPPSAANVIVRDTVKKYEKLLALRTKVSRYNRLLKEGRHTTTGLQKISTEELERINKERTETLSKVKELEEDLGML